MKKGSTKKHSDDYELREEYDFSTMPIMPRGRYAPGKRVAKNLVVLAPDVAAAFPDDTSVNDALRLLLQLSKLLRMQPTPTQSEV